MLETPRPPTPLARPARIALLIDADNSPAAKIDVVLAELAQLGVANIRRAYGNWKKNELKGWEAVLHEYAIRPIQQFDVSKGKNATDMLIAIDAMDLLYTDQPDAFGIVSSDADFTPLVMHLRAKGATVYGFGAKKTPTPFVNACSRFLYLEHLGVPDVSMDNDLSAGASAQPARPAGRTRRAAEPVAVAAGPAKEAAAPARKRRSDARPSTEILAVGAAESGATSSAVAPAEQAVSVLAASGAAAVELRRDARLVSLLRNAIVNAAGDDGWSNLSAVRTQISNQASFDPRNHGYRKFSDLVDAIGLFETERRGQNLYVRDKRQAMSGKRLSGER